MINMEFFELSEPIKTLNEISFRNFFLKKGYYYGTDDEYEFDIYLAENYIGKFKSGFDEPDVTISNRNLLDDYLNKVNSITPITNYIDNYKNWQLAYLFLDIAEKTLPNDYIN